MPLFFEGMESSGLAFSLQFTFGPATAWRRGPERVFTFGATCGESAERIGDAGDLTYGGGDKHKGMKGL